MKKSGDEIDILDFSDAEIEDEYIRRFGDPGESDIDDFDTSELIDELNSRGEYPEREPPDNLGEVADHIAEAARACRHAARAYALLSEAYPGALPALHARQSLIAGRMGEATL